MKKIKKARNAKDGKFVSKEFAKENPDTTVTETITVKTKEDVQPISVEE